MKKVILSLILGLLILNIFSIISLEFVSGDCGSQYSPMPPIKIAQGDISGKFASWDRNGNCVICITDCTFWSDNYCGEEIQNWQEVRVYEGEKINVNIGNVDNLDGDRIQICETSGGDCGNPAWTGGKKNEQVVLDVEFDGYLVYLVWGERGFENTEISLEPCPNADGDGYDVCPIGDTWDDENEKDCNDDPATGGSINPGEEEIYGDFIDNDCDGQIDACPTSMISYWKMDENTIDSYGDYDGELGGCGDPLNTNWCDWEEGILNQAFHKKASQTDMKIENAQKLQFNSGDKFTIEAFVKFDSFGNYQTAIFSEADGFGSLGYGLFLGDKRIPEENGKLLFVEGEGNKIKGNTALTEEDTWYHIAVTYDGSQINYDGSQIKFYVNGEPDGGGDYEFTPDWNKDDFWVGWGTNMNLYGYIDELAVYNGALTEEEIKSHWNDGKGKDYCTPCTPKTCGPEDCEILDDGCGGKIDCGTCEEIGEAYWANMKKEKIGEQDNSTMIKSQLRDTVLMIAEDTGLSEGTPVIFEIYEDDWSDSGDYPIRTTSEGNAIEGYVNSDGDAIGKWTITQTDLDARDLFSSEEFVFKINPSGTELESNKLEIEETERNDRLPSATIIIPLNEEKFSVNWFVNYVPELQDDDDDLEVTWNFGDGTEETITDCLTYGNCSTTHDYDDWGTKIITLTAREMERIPQGKDTDFARIFIYDENINVFSVITDPAYGQIFDIGSRSAYFNGSGSYVANCTINACPEGIPNFAVGGTSASCYEINMIGGDTLHCFNLDNNEIAENTFNLWFNWTFSEGKNINGSWKDNYDKYIEFDKMFLEPKNHWAKLQVGYENLQL